MHAGIFQLGDAKLLQTNHMAFSTQLGISMSDSCSSESVTCLHKPLWVEVEALLLNLLF